MPTPVNSCLSASIRIHESRHGQRCLPKVSDYTKPSHIYCDARDLQLGAVIMPENAPVASYSRTLNNAQTHGENFSLSLRLSKSIEQCFTDVQTSMSTQTINITHDTIWMSEHLCLFRLYHHYFSQYTHLTRPTRLIWMSEHLCLFRLYKQYFYSYPNPMRPTLAVAH
jgi:hypothetical protein